MVRAYHMTQHEFPKSLSSLPVPPPITPPWRFLKLKELMQRPAGPSGNDERYQNLKSLLEVAKQGAFKIWSLEPILGIIAKVAGVAALLAVFYALWVYRNSPIVTYGALGALLAGFGFSVVLAKLV